MDWRWLLPLLFNYSQHAVNLISNIKTTQIYAKITNQKISQDMEVLSQKLESFEKQIIKQI